MFSIPGPCSNSNFTPDQSLPKLRKTPQVSVENFFFEGSLAKRGDASSTSKNLLKSSSHLVMIKYPYIESLNAVWHALYNLSDSAFYWNAVNNSKKNSCLVDFAYNIKDLLDSKLTPSPQTIQSILDSAKIKNSSDKEKTKETLNRRLNVAQSNKDANLLSAFWLQDSALQQLISVKETIINAKNKSHWAAPLFSISDIRRLSLETKIEEFEVAYQHSKEELNRQISSNKSTFSEEARVTSRSDFLKNRGKLDRPFFPQHLG